MTEQEEKIINESIKSYENMIKYLREQIEILSAKKYKRCCFDKNIEHKIKIKQEDT